MTQEERDAILVDLNSKVSSLNSKVSSLDAKVGSLQQDVKSLKEDVEHISGRVAVIEQEHGEKIQALLDGESMILDELDWFKKKLESEEEKLEIHDAKIYCLESKNSSL